MSHNSKANWHQIAYVTSISQQGDIQDVAKVLNIEDHSCRILIQLPEELDIASMAWSPQKDRIAFTTQDSRTDTRDLWVANADGSEPEKLVHEATLVGAPAWSFDGHKLTFASYNPDVPPQPPLEAKVYNILHVLDLTTGQQTQLPLSRGCAWAPTDDQLAVVLVDDTNDENSGIYVMAGDGTRSKKIAPLEFPTGLAWAPDGQQIALMRPVTRDRDGIVLIDLNSGQQTWLTQSVQYEKRQFGDLLWSPDGRYLLFSVTHAKSAPSEGFNVLFLLGLCSQQERVLLSVGMGGINWLGWSPDSSQVAFSGKLEGAERSYEQLYTVSVETSQVTQLTDTDGWKRGLDW